MNMKRNAAKSAVNLGYSQFIYIQLSNARGICGVWPEEPDDNSRAIGYSKYMKKEMDVRATNSNCWIEKHELTINLIEPSSKS